MSSKHIVAAGVVMGTVVSAGQAASVALLTDGRAVESSVWTGDPVEPIERTDRVEANPGQMFKETLDLSVTSPDASTMIAACAEQTSVLTFDQPGTFQFTGQLRATTATSFNPIPGGQISPDGFGFPTSIFDVVIDTAMPLTWELQLEMQTQGDAATRFSAFDVTYAIAPLASDAQSFLVAGEIEAGRYRILADVVAPSDPFFGGSLASLDFTLRATTISPVAAPIPTAFASAAALMAAGLLPRRRY